MLKTTKKMRRPTRMTDRGGTKTKRTMVTRMEKTWRRMNESIMKAEQARSVEDE